MFRNSTISGRCLGCSRLSGGSRRSLRCCVAVFRVSVCVRDPEPGPSPDAYALYLTWDGFRRVGGRGDPGPSPFSPRPAPPPIARVPADRNASDTPSTSFAALASSRLANSFRVRTDWSEPTGRAAVSSRRARVTRPAAAALWTLGSRARPSLARPSACSNPGGQGLLPRAPRSVVLATGPMGRGAATRRVRPNGRERES